MRRILFAMLLLLLAACSTPQSSTAPPAASADALSALPRFSHIFVIVMENKSFDDVLASPNRYVTQLGHQYGIAANYHGITHPSLPNYLALLGGDTFNVTSNCTDCFIDQPSLIEQLDANDISWKAYIESLPSPCYVGDHDPLYKQKHNPFMYFDSIRKNPKLCANVVPFAQFSTDLANNALPQFVWITPNMCSDMHDCTIAQGDAWLKQHVPEILKTAAWKNNGVLFITFDEALKDTSTCCKFARGGRVPMLVASPLSKPGFVSDVEYSHYSLLRTVETNWKLPLLGKADCDCSPVMNDFFDSALERNNTQAARSGPQMQ